MLRFVLLALVALALIYENATQTEEIAGSKNFHLSGGMSKQMYLLMYNQGVGAEELKKFVQLEDRFLQIERNSVCSGVSHTVEATALSNLIKDMFPKYNFAYHGIHLKQIAEPTKTVNTLITCS
jgi:hypothetical protein